MPVRQAASSTARAPTEKMIGFARRLARARGVSLPEGVETDYRACRSFLDAHAPANASRRPGAALSGIQEAQRFEHPAGVRGRGGLRGCPAGPSRRRLLALANALEGMPREEAARLAGMTGQTLGDWVHRYNQEGVAGLRDRPRPGRPCGLDEGQQAALKALVLGGPSLKRDGCVAWRAPGPVRPGRAPLRRALQRDRHAAAAARARPLLAEGAAGPPRGRPEAQARFKKACPR